MRVLILRGVTLEGGTTTKPGDKVDVDDKAAAYLIRMGKAEEIVTKTRKPKAVKKDD